MNLNEMSTLSSNTYTINNIKMKNITNLFNNQDIISIVFLVNNLWSHKTRIISIEKNSKIQMKIQIQHITKITMNTNATGEHVKINIIDYI